MPFFNRDFFTRRFGEQYIPPLVFWPEFAFVSSGYTNDVGSTTTFQHIVTEPLTDGYMFLAMTLYTPSQLSGDNIGATFNGQGLIPIPITGGSGIILSSNRSMHLRGAPLGVLPTGIYNISVRGTGIGGSVDANFAALSFRNINQLNPTGTLVVNPTSTVSGKSVRPPTNGVGDIALAIFGHSSFTGDFTSTLTKRFGSGILSVATAPTTGSETFLRGFTTGSTNQVLIGMSLLKP